MSSRLAELLDVKRKGWVGIDLRRVAGCGTGAEALAREDKQRHDAEILVLFYLVNCYSIVVSSHYHAWPVTSSWVRSKSRRKKILGQTRMVGTPERNSCFPTNIRADRLIPGRNTLSSACPSHPGEECISLQSSIIQSVEHNRHEHAALRRGAGNALTISGQQAYHNRPVASVSQSSGNGMYNWVLTWSDRHECRNAGIGTQKRDIVRNMPDCVTH